MLSYLRIRGLALLEDVALELSPGLNVLTGETGAGKSIIVDALALLRGARARTDLVRAGANECTVDAQFDLGSELGARLGPLLQARGLPDDVGSLVVKRATPRGGRGRSFLQSELVTQQVLAEVGEHLIDICSQHEHHSLTRVTRHGELLDSYAGSEQLLGDYAIAYARLREAERTLERLRDQGEEAVRRADYLRFQVDELERAAPEPGELDALRSRVELLRDAQGWADFAALAQDLLSDSDSAVLTQISRLLDRARRGSDHVAQLAAMATELETAKAACEEAASLCSRLAADLDLDPGDLDRAEERLHLLTTLARKHGSLAELPATLEAMREELDTLDHAEERIAELEHEIASLRATSLGQARQLHDQRLAAADQLGRALERELVALHLPRTRLEARVEALGTDQLGPRGFDRVEFLFSANPGEPLAPLTRVASGGELSRVLLALKGVLATTGAVATYVFDEIDAGVGGAVAQAIGQRLQRAAATSQVLCITHLPQIAACADTHFRVEKRSQGGRTITRVTALDPDQRIEELARMVGGKKVTASAREHARQLLAETRRPAGKRKK